MPRKNIKSIAFPAMTLDKIDSLFEKYGGIDEIIEESQSTCGENQEPLPEPNYDVLYEDDNMRIVATGCCLVPSDNEGTPVELKNIQIFDAIMETRESEDEEYEVSCSVIYIQIDDDWYYETESYISAAIHNYFHTDMTTIAHMQFKICV